MAQQFANNAQSRTWTGAGSKYAIQIGVLTNKGRFILLPNGSLGFDESHLIEQPKNFFEEVQNKVILHILNREEFKALKPQESWILGTLDSLKLTVRIKNMMARPEEDDSFDF